MRWVKYVERNTGWCMLICIIQNICKETTWRT